MPRAASPSIAARMALFADNGDAQTGKPAQNRRITPRRTVSPRMASRVNSFDRRKPRAAPPVAAAQQNPKCSPRPQADVALATSSLKPKPSAVPLLPIEVMPSAPKVLDSPARLASKSSDEGGSSTPQPQPSSI